MSFYIYDLMNQFFRGMLYTFQKNLITFLLEILFLLNVIDNNENLLICSASILNQTYEDTLLAWLLLMGCFF